MTQQGELGETGSIVDFGTPVEGGAFDDHKPPDAALHARNQVAGDDENIEFRQ